MQGILKHFFIFLRGMGMGTADIIPGVSGGTIAFITGIYDKLVETVNRFDHRAVKLFFRGQFSSFFKHINWKFLLPLLLGVATAIITLASIISSLLDTHRIYLWGFFFGLIAASALVIMQQIKSWHLFRFALLFAGVLFAFLITTYNLFTLPEGNFYLFISGLFAIVAMILPGVSGSYILLLMGKYEEVIGIVSSLSDSLKEILSGLRRFDFLHIAQSFGSIPWVQLILFASGCIIGLISFAKMLNWLLKKFYYSTMSVLTGFLIGSLNLVWPWKHTISWRESSDGSLKPLQESNILPNTLNLETLYVFLLALVGFLLVYFINRIAGSKKI